MIRWLAPIVAILLATFSALAALRQAGVPEHVAARVPPKPVVEPEMVDVLSVPTQGDLAWSVG